MTTLTPYTFEGQDVRTLIGEDGEPRFVLADLAAVLGIANSRNVAARLDDDEKGVCLADTPGGRQNVTVVTEAGMYSVIVRSDSPAAGPFRRWVTHEVLPSIRKTGSYSTAPALPQSYAEALRELAATVEQREALAAKVEQDAPKVLAFEQYMTAEGDYSMDAAAKMLSDVTGVLGRNRLFAWLRERKVLMTGNRPYQAHAHLFRVIASTYEDRNGTTHTTYTTYVRPQGVEAIRRWFSKAVVG